MARNLPESLSLMAAKLTRYIQQDAPRIIGKMHRDEIAEAFEKEGYTDSSFEPWPEVKRREPGKMKKGKKGQILKNQPPEQKHKILHSRQNNLKRGFGYEINGDSVEVGTDVEYGKYHNEGSDTAGRNRNTKLPKRQIIGDGQALKAKIEDKFKTDITNILK